MTKRNEKALRGLGSYLVIALVLYFGSNTAENKKLSLQFGLFTVGIRIAVWISGDDNE